MAFRTPALLILALAITGVSAPAAEAAVYAVARYEMDVVTVMDPAAIEPVVGSANLRRAWSVSIQRNLVSGGPQQPGYVLP